MAPTAPTPRLKIPVAIEYRVFVRAIVLSLLFTTTVYADIAPAPPDPQRPEWEHTPMPMPTEPTEVALLVVFLLVVGIWWLRRARRSEEA